MAIAQLSIDLVAKIATFEKDLKRATTATEQQTKKMSASFDFVKGAIKGMAGALSVGLFVAAVKDVANYADSLGKMAQRVGVTTEALSGLAYAASLSDVSNEQLGTGLQKLSKLMQEASGGMDQQKRILKELGVTTSTDVNKAFEQLADRFSEMEEGTGKIAASIAVFGRAGAQMLPLLNSGADGIRAATEEARQFGLIVGGDAVKATELFNDNLTRLEGLAKGARIALLSDLVVGISHATSAFIESAKEGNRFIGVINGINALFNGDDKHKNNVRMVELTDEMLQLENDISRLRGRQGDQAKGMLKTAQDRLAVVNEEIKTTMAYRAVLFTDEQDKPKKTGKVNSAIFSTAGASTLKDLGKAGRDLADSLLAQAGGLSPSFLAQWDKLSEAHKNGALSTERLIQAQAALLEQQPFQKDALDAVVKSAEARQDARNKEYNDIIAYQAEVVSQEEKFWRDILAATPTAQLDEQRKTVAKITEAFANGRYDAPESAAAAATYGEVINTYLGNIPLAVEASKSAAEELGLSFSSAFEDAIVGGKELSTVIDGLIKDMLRMAVRETVTKPLANYFSSALSGMLSFDGGGTTPSGARAGGVDGKGGFLSVLHPNETVIDHTKGQKSGGNVTVYQNFTVGDVASVSMVRQAVAGSERRIAAGFGRSMNYGGAVA